MSSNLETSKPRFHLKVTLGSLTLGFYFLDIFNKKGLSWLSQKVRELLEWRFGEACLFPELGCQETISLQEAIKSGLDEIAKGLGGTTG